MPEEKKEEAGRKEGGMKEGEGNCKIWRPSAGRWGKIAVVIQSFGDVMGCFHCLPTIIPLTPRREVIMVHSEYMLPFKLHCGPPEL